MQLKSTLTCPSCGHKSTETMPVDACQFFHDCKGSGRRLKPKAGDCCVFCSFGSVQKASEATPFFERLCPPVQQSGKCC